jgi:uncharacterized membrane protein (DUF4010 family)
METVDIFKAIGMSLGLGLLVGLQREHAASLLAGIRTFALVTLLGTVMALLSEPYGGWLVAVGGLCVAALLFVGNLAKMRREHAEPGLTTEVAALLMYGVGAYLVLGAASVAVILGGIVAVLLQFKQPMHSFVSRMGTDDLRVIMQFVLLALVILPVLPDEHWGPFGAFNPYETWLMVVLIVGISLAGYIIYKFFDQDVGTVLAGMLGGLVSSTATTVSYARRTRQEPRQYGTAALIIAIASAVAIGRVVVEVVAVAPPIVRHVTPPLVAMFAWMAALSLVAYRFGERNSADATPPKNPAELRTALAFAALYAAIKFAVTAVRHYFGDAALFAVAGISGLTDLDAITLSTAKLVEGGTLDSDLGWRLILAAAVSNLAFKAAIALAIGDRRLAWRSTALFAAGIVGGVLILWLWPSDQVNQWIDWVFAEQA